MGNITRQRDIIDRRVLAEELATAAGSVQIREPRPPAAPGPSEGGARRRTRRDPPPLRGERRRHRGRARAMLSDGSADPRAVRRGHRRDLPAPQPDFGRASGIGRGRRLWARRTGALFRHRPIVPAALQADPPHRAGRRIAALSVVGPEAQDRSGDALGRGLPAPSEIRSDDPHRSPRGALSVGRGGVVPRAQKALRQRDRARHRGAVRRSEARRARPAPPPRRRQPLPARAERQGGEGRSSRPAHALLARQIHLSHRRCRQARRSAACCRPRSCSALPGRRAFCGRCAAICIFSPDAPRSG